MIKPPFSLTKWAWGGELIRLDSFETDSNYFGKIFKLRYDGDNKYSVFYNGNLLASGSVGQLIATPPHFEPQIRLKVDQIVANSGAHFNIIRKNTDDVILEIVQSLSIIDLGEKNKSRTGVLQLSYQGYNPRSMARILNAILKYAIQRNIENKSAEASKTLNFLNKQLPQVRKSLNEVETNLKEYRARSGTLDIAQESKIILTQLSGIEQSIANLRIRKVEMLQELTPEHPFIRTVSLKQQQLQREADHLARKIRTLPHADQKAISLEREVKVKNQLYLLLLNSIQQLQVLKAGTLSDIRILSQASTPIIPLPKHSAFTILMGTMIGFFIAILILIIRETLHSKVNSHEVIEDRLGIATFAIIPYCKKQKELSAKLKHKILPSGCYVLAQHSPKDVASEAFRSLRTMLQFHYETTSNNITCLLGATPSIGKSFTSINLAHVLSELGKRILLIDADMRKGHIEQAFGKSRAPGFAELLVNPQIRDKVIKPVSNNLDFISCGNYPNNPSELLMTDNTNQIMAELANLYDQIIIDTSPILAVTDAIILARKAGTNLLVVGGGSNELAELDLTANSAKKNGVAIHGIIFNQITPTKNLQGNYSYYYATD